MLIIFPIFNQYQDSSKTNSPASVFLEHMSELEYKLPYNYENCPFK